MGRQRLIFQPEASDPPWLTPPKPNLTGSSALTHLLGEVSCDLMISSCYTVVKYILRLTYIFIHINSKPFVVISSEKPWTHICLVVQMGQSGKDKSCCQGEIYFKVFYSVQRLFCDESQEQYLYGSRKDNRDKRPVPVQSGVLYK